MTTTYHSSQLALQHWPSNVHYCTVHLTRMLVCISGFATISNDLLRHGRRFYNPVQNQNPTAKFQRPVLVHQLVSKSSRSNRDKCITGMKHKDTPHSCGLASVMQATSRRQRHADSAKRTCCRKPAVLDDHTKHLSSSAADNQRKSSTTVLKQLFKVITFGSKKAQRSDPNPSASLVRETVQASRYKPTCDFLVDVNASAYGLEGPGALREPSDAPSNCLLRSYQGLIQ